MEENRFKELRNKSLLYLAGMINSSALGLLAFIIVYKVHINFGTPPPSVNGLTFIVLVGMLIFKHRIEEDLEEKGISIQDALPKIVSRTVCGIIALVLVFNIDVVFNSMTSFSDWLTDYLVN